MTELPPEAVPVDHAVGSGGTAGSEAKAPAGLHLVPDNLEPFRRNKLLAALPAAELERLAPHLELIELPLGQVLYETSEVEQCVYFPTTVIVSLLYVMQNGDSAELAVVGNDGVVGVSLFMGGLSTTSRAVVQNAGEGYRLSRIEMMSEFDRAGPVMRLMLRYTQALIAQMSQTGGCNKHHSTEEQLCRWLLLSLDRLPSNALVMSLALIAKMLGVGLDAAADAVDKLESLGMVGYTDGYFTVRNRSGLEARSCECYEAVKKEYARLLPHEIAT
jgi:CRP-like cAMP-binding protein